MRISLSKSISILTFILLRSLLPTSEAFADVQIEYKQLLTSLGHAEELLQESDDDSIAKAALYVGVSLVVCLSLVVLGHWICRKMMA